MARTVTVGRSVANVIHRRLSEVQELPAPGAEWSWTRVPVSQSTLQHLKTADLIVQVEPGTWRTSRRLAWFLRERHDVELRRQTRVTVF